VSYSRNITGKERENYRVNVIVQQQVAAASSRANNCNNCKWRTTRDSFPPPDESLSVVFLSRRSNSSRRASLFENLSQRTLQVFAKGFRSLLLLMFYLFAFYCNATISLLIPLSRAGGELINSAQASERTIFARGFSQVFKRADIAWLAKQFFSVACARETSDDITRTGLRMQTRTMLFDYSRITLVALPRARITDPDSRWTITLNESWETMKLPDALASQERRSSLRGNYVHSSLSSGLPASRRER
jgi:hypothetical protein